MSSSIKIGQTTLYIEGTSHAPALKFSLSGLPEGVRVDIEKLKAFMERRAPGRDRLSTSRKEPDEVMFHGGIDKYGWTDGGEIYGEILNTNVRPGDYGEDRTVPRPGHADFPQWIEFGRIPTGGGANSGRMTAALCAAGGLCLQFLEREYGISISARIVSIGGKTEDPEGEIERAKADLDSVGGVIECVATGVPAGFGGALFDGLESAISQTVFAIPGVKGIEFGNGFAAAALRGSENNDEFTVEDGRVSTATNRHGGILGGRASGTPVVFRVAMKPTPTVFKPQKSVDLATMQPATCAMKGRHDPCIVRRAVPVVEAAAAFALAAKAVEDFSRQRICLVLAEKTLEEDLAVYRSQRYFSDLVELRVDKLEPRERERAARFPSLVDCGTILTIRRKRDGGDWVGGEEDRARLFKKLLSEASGRKKFAYVDFEDDFRRRDLDKAADAAETDLIRSWHSFEGPPEDFRLLVKKLSRNGEIPKIAFTAHGSKDVAELYRALEKAGFPYGIFCAMGRHGFATRVLPGKFGSAWTYASTGGVPGEVGHVSPLELVRDWRLREQDAAYAIFTTGEDAFERAKEKNARFSAEDSDEIAIPVFDDGERLLAETIGEEK